jgi:hypothetical protein
MECRFQDSGNLMISVHELPFLKGKDKWIEQGQSAQVRASGIFEDDLCKWQAFMKRSRYHTLTIL